MLRSVKNLYNTLKKNKLTKLESIVIEYSRDKKAIAKAHVARINNNGIPNEQAHLIYFTHTITVVITKE